MSKGVNPSETFAIIMYVGKTIHVLNISSENYDIIKIIEHSDEDMIPIEISPNGKNIIFQSVNYYIQRPRKIKIWKILSIRNIQNRGNLKKNYIE